MADTPNTQTTPNPTEGHKVFTHEDLQKFAEVTRELRTVVEKSDKDFTERFSGVKSEVITLGEKLDTMEAALQKKYDEFEARLNRARAEAETSDEQKDAARSKWKSLQGYLRATDPTRVDNAKAAYIENIEGYHKKDYIVSDDTLGGIFAGPEVLTEMITDLQEVNPIRGVARQRTTSMRSVKAPRRTEYIAASWANEQDTSSNTNANPFGWLEIFTYGLTAVVAISREDLEDPQFNLESFLREEMRDQFGIAEGIAFVNGVGGSQPMGFMTDGNITSITSKTAGALDGDDFVEMYYDLHTNYLNANAAWVMRRSTVKEVRLLKDGEGRPLWVPNMLQDARPSSILGANYIMADAMPTVAAGNYPVIFGDWRMGYWIVDRLSIEFLSDPYTRKKDGFVEIMARKRVGGQVVQPKALRKLLVRS